MPFDSGRVTFCRFAVSGDAPSSVDEATLSILKEHRFRETEIGAPDEVESGFVTPEHLLDTRFTFEKVGFGPGGSQLLVGVRIDTHKVPAEVKRAYRVMNEQSAASENPSGFATKGQKQEARELADRQVREDLAKGLYRKSKVVPVLWDFATRRVFCGASGTTVIEQVVRLFRQSFAVELSLLSAGVAAGEMIRAKGRSRDYEDVTPSAFTKPPAETAPGNAAGIDEDGLSGPSGVPSLPWIAKAVDLKDFLGNELLMWLWWHTETKEGAIAIPGGEAYLALDRSLDLDCAWGLGGKVSVRGDGPTRLRESAEALRTGKWPRKAGLLLSDGAQQWELTLQGDAWTVGSAKLPEVPDAQSPRELTDARLELTSLLGRLLDGLYEAFLDKRLSAGWPTQRDAVRSWIRNRQRPARASSMPEVVVTAHVPPSPSDRSASVPAQSA